MQQRFIKMWAICWTETQQAHVKSQSKSIWDHFYLYYLFTGQGGGGQKEQME